MPEATPLLPRAKHCYKTAAGSARGKFRRIPSFSALANNLIYPGVEGEANG